MTKRGRSPLTVIDLEDLGFDEGGYILVSRALTDAPAVDVRGRDPNLAVHLAAWARAEGHAVSGSTVTRGSGDRWHDAMRAGGPDPVDRPPASWGLAARGALGEAGGPER